MSTGPTTPEGRERIAAAQRKRWARVRPRAVRIIAVEVSLGHEQGMVRRGETPTLPGPIADMLLARGMAALIKPASD